MRQQLRSNSKKNVRGKIYTSKNFIKIHSPHIDVSSSKGVFGFSIFENSEKKAGMETHVYKMKLKSDVATLEN